MACRAVPIRRDLHTICEPLLQVIDKIDGRVCGPVAYQGGAEQLRIGADCGLRPDTTSIVRRGNGDIEIGLFGVDEIPNLIELHALAREVPKHPILVRRASVAASTPSLVTVFLGGVIARIDTPSQRR
jgi:hypothetical protein